LRFGQGIFSGKRGLGWFSWFVVLLVVGIQHQFWQEKTRNNRLYVPTVELSEAIGYGSGLCLLLKMHGSVFVLTAYGDETGVHDGAPVAIWGGFVADSEKWEAFGKDWTSRLAKDGLDHFHMSHFKADKYPFDRMSRVAHELLEKDLSQIIADYSISGVASAIHRPGWDGMASPQTTAEYGDSVRIGFHISLREFIKFCRENHPDESIMIIYGSGSLEGPLRDFISAFIDARDSYSEHLAGVGFRAMKKEPGIQAADMLIWELNSRFKQALRSDGSIKITPGTTLDRLCRGGISVRTMGSNAAAYLGKA
jgi:hypothetical protein